MPVTTAKGLLAVAAAVDQALGQAAIVASTHAQQAAPPPAQPQGGKGAGNANQGRLRHLA